VALGLREASVLVVLAVLGIETAVDVRAALPNAQQQAVVRAVIHEAVRDARSCREADGVARS
jgi:hypothetical protein